MEKYKKKIRSDRGYILWHIKSLIEVFKILFIINGHMRTLKYDD